MQDLLNKIQYLINKKNITEISELSKLLQVEEYQVRGLIDMLIIQGALLAVNNESVIKLKKPIKDGDVYQIPSNLTHIKLLLISDTHLASKYDRLDILEYLYDKAAANGVQYVLHSGDVTDGKSNRPEHQYELKELSYQGQVDYVIDNYPKRDGIKTFMIAGNHDQWWYKSAGSDIVQSVANKREDIIYLGPDIADLKIGKLKVHLFHGQGAASYAVSYKLQRYVNHMSVAQKPHILQTGHIHRSFYMNMDGTHCFQTSALIDQTPFARSMGFGNEKSCWWVDVYLDEKGLPYLITPQLELFNDKKMAKKR